MQVNFKLNDIGPGYFPFNLKIGINLTSLNECAQVILEYVYYSQIFLRRCKRQKLKATKKLVYKNKILQS